MDTQLTKEAIKVIQIADYHPDELSLFETIPLLAARGFSESLAYQLKGERGQGAGRKRVRNRIRILDNELSKRDIDNSLQVIHKMWPSWKLDYKIVLKKI